MKNTKVKMGFIVGALAFIAIAINHNINSNPVASNITEKISTILRNSIDNDPNIETICKNESLDPLKTVITSDKAIEYNGITYKIIQVDGGDLSGSRDPNVAVDVGYGDRIYWAFTNEHSQLVYVIADKIVLQDESTEPVNSKGRYYNDEAKVPGTERKDLDEGHVIADSLGGVSNAYNITPQNSTLNRYGNQAYMEKVIRDAGGCDHFVAIITYTDTKTQIPSHYHYEYVLKGNAVVDDFDNMSPDK